MSQSVHYKGGEKRIIGIISDEDTVTGFLLAGIGDNRLSMTHKKAGSGKGELLPNYLVVGPSTPLSEIESTFRSMCTRGDIAIIIISQHISKEIRHLIEEHTAVIPSILEIPGKGQKYDPEKDIVLEKVNRALGIR